MYSRTHTQTMDAHQNMFNVLFAITKEYMEKFDKLHPMDYDNFEQYVTDTNNKWERIQYLLDMSHDIASEIDDFEFDDDYDDESDTDSVNGQLVEEGDESDVESGDEAESEHRD